jgi:Flp pilus assembly protein TadD
LTARETEAGRKVILPVWHGLNKADLLRYSPTLADRIGVSTDGGIDHVADQLARVLEFANDRPATGSARQRVVQAVPDSNLLVPKAAAASPAQMNMTPKVTALIALAQTLIEQGDYLAAETYLRAAVDSGDSHASMLLGMVMRDQGRLEESEVLFTKAVDSGHSEALTPLGLVLHELGKLDAAADVLHRAVAASD